MKKIAVIGGTGMLGQPVARRLLEAGYPIRVLSTQAGKVKRIFGEKVEEVLGGVEEPESLNKLIQGCWGVHLNLLGGPKKEDFFRIEAEGTRKVVAACKQHGVKKITMTSGMALYHVKPQEVVREDYPNFPAAAKYQAEQHIIQSGLDYTIFRPTSFIDTFGKYIRGNTAYLMGSMDHDFHWLTGADYAAYVLLAYERPIARNKIYPLLGAEKLSYAQAEEKFFSLAAPNVRKLRIPMGFLRFMALFVPPLRTGLKLMKVAGNYEEVEGSLTFKELGKPQHEIEMYLKQLGN